MRFLLLFLVFLPFFNWISWKVHALKWKRPILHQGQRPPEVFFSTSTELADPNVSFVLYDLLKLFQGDNINFSLKNQNISEGISIEGPFNQISVGHSETLEVGNDTNLVDSTILLDQKRQFGVILYSNNSFIFFAANETKENFTIYHEITEENTTCQAIASFDLFIVVNCFQTNFSDGDLLGGIRVFYVYQLNISSDSAFLSVKPRVIVNKYPDSFVSPNAKWGFLYMSSYNEEYPEPPYFLFYNFLRSDSTSDSEIEVYSIQKASPPSFTFELKLTRSSFSIFSDSVFERTRFRIINIEKKWRYVFIQTPEFLMKIWIDISGGEIEENGFYTFGGGVSGKLLVSLISERTLVTAKIKGKDGLIVFETEIYVDGISVSKCGLEEERSKRNKMKPNSPSQSQNGDNQHRRLNKTSADPIVYNLFTCKKFIEFDIPPMNDHFFVQVGGISQVFALVYKEKQANESYFLQFINPVSLLMVGTFTMNFNRELRLFGDPSSGKLLAISPNGCFSFSFITDPYILIKFTEPNYTKLQNEEIWRSFEQKEKQFLKGGGSLDEEGAALSLPSFKEPRNYKETSSFLEFEVTASFGGKEKKTWGTINIHIIDQSECIQMFDRKNPFNGNQTIQLMKRQNDQVELDIQDDMVIGNAVNFQITNGDNFQDFTCISNAREGNIIAPNESLTQKELEFSLFTKAPLEWRSDGVNPEFLGFFYASNTTKVFDCFGKFNSPDIFCQRWFTDVDHAIPKTPNNLLVFKSFFMFGFELENHSDGDYKLFNFTYFHCQTQFKNPMQINLMKNCEYHEYLFLGSLVCISMNNSIIIYSVEEAGISYYGIINLEQTDSEDFIPILTKPGFTNDILFVGLSNQLIALDLDLGVEQAVVRSTLSISSVPVEYNFCVNEQRIIVIIKGRNSLMVLDISNIDEITHLFDFPVYGSIYHPFNFARTPNGYFYIALKDELQNYMIQRYRMNTLSALHAVFDNFFRRIPPDSTPFRFSTLSKSSMDIVVVHDPVKQDPELMIDLFYAFTSYKLKWVNKYSETNKVFSKEFKVESESCSLFKKLEFEYIDFEAKTLNPSMNFSNVSWTNGFSDASFKLTKISSLDIFSGNLIIFNDSDSKGLLQTKKNQNEITIRNALDDLKSISIKWKDGQASNPINFIFHQKSTESFFILADKQLFQMTLENETLLEKFSINLNSSEVFYNWKYRCGKASGDFTNSKSFYFHIECRMLSETILFLLKASKDSEPEIITSKTYSMLISQTTSQSSYIAMYESKKVDPLLFSEQTIGVYFQKEYEGTLKLKKFEINLLDFSDSGYFFNLYDLSSMRLNGNRSVIFVLTSEKIQMVVVDESYFPDIYSDSKNQKMFQIKTFLFSDHGENSINLPNKDRLMIFKDLKCFLKGPSQFYCVLATVNWFHYFLVFDYDDQTATIKFRKSHYFYCQSGFPAKVLAISSEYFVAVVSNSEKKKEFVLVYDLSVPFRNEMVGSNIATGSFIMGGIKVPFGLSEGVFVDVESQSIFIHNECNVSRIQIQGPPVLIMKENSLKKVFGFYGVDVDGNKYNAQIIPDKSHSHFSFLDGLLASLLMICLLAFLLCILCLCCYANAYLKVNRRLRPDSFNDTLGSFETSLQSLSEEMNKSYQ